MNDPIIFVFIAIASGSLGFLIGFMVRAVTRRGVNKPEEPENQEEGIGQEATQRETPEPKKAPNKNWVEVANLWRDQRNGKIIFQIENQYYKSNNDLTSKERKVLLKVVIDFLHWLDPMAEVPLKQKPEPPANPVPEAEPVPLADFVDNAPDILEKQEESKQPKKGTLNPLSIFANALNADISPISSQAPTMVSQVDEILQEKIVAAKMQKWAIRLTELPNKGMVVLVGLEQYDSIDAVPYERVRKIIRESVAEWEQRAENI